MVLGFGKNSDRVAEVAYSMSFARSMHSLFCMRHQNSKELNGFIQCQAKQLPVSVDTFFIGCSFETCKPTQESAEL